MMVKALRYWVLSLAVSLGLFAICYAGLPALSQLLDINGEHLLAYAMLLFGFSSMYFGFLKPHWFKKEIIPSGHTVKLKVAAHSQSKPSLKDDSYFWQVFPYGLFFCVGGLIYLLQPNVASLAIAFGCAAWVKIMYRWV